MDRRINRERLRAYELGMPDAMRASIQDVRVYTLIMEYLGHDPVITFRDIPHVEAGPYGLSIVSFIWEVSNQSNYMSLENEFNSLFYVMLNVTLELTGAIPSVDHLIITLGSGDRYVSTRRTLIENTTPLEFYEAVIGRIASDEAFDISDVVVSFKVISMPVVPTAGGSTMSEACEKFVSSKRCCIPIVSPDDSCFFQCLALGLADEVEFTNLTKNAKRPGVLRKRIEVASRYGKGKVEIDDIHIYEKKFECSIIVYALTTLEHMRQPSKKYSKKIYMLFDDQGEGHYTFIRPKMQAGLWGKNFYWCVECDNSFRGMMHKCFKTCNRCKYKGCALRPDNHTATLLCKTCNRKFHDDVCLKNHKKSGVCRSVHHCLVCNHDYQVVKGEVHECGMRKCRFCKEVVDVNHLCYIQPDTTQPEPTTEYVFYDYECMLGPDGEQIPACICANTMDEPKCVRFQSTEEFIEWVRKKDGNYTCIAHNAGSYDVLFIKNYLVSQRIKSKDIMTGRKITSITVKWNKHSTTRFIDSIRFTMASLRKFPKMFGLPEIKKTYFPYEFYTPENKHYSGPMPSINWYPADVIETPDFLEWWSEHKNDYIEDLHETCMEYCDIDVEVLRAGCIVFRQKFLDMNPNNDPFQNTTIASTVMKDYRMQDLEHGQIAILPHNPCIEEKAMWRQTRGEALHENIPVRELVPDFPEFDIGNEIVDLVDIEGTWHFFRSCMDVGCRCTGMQGFSINTNTSQFYNSHHDNWMAFKNKIYNITTKCRIQVIFWKACEIPKIEYEFKNRDINPRDAFFGGRTEDFYRGVIKVPEGWHMNYLDYTSLYPSVQKGVLRGVTPESYHAKRYVEYPVGHPINIRDPKIEDLDKYFGIATAKVYVPESTYLPCLPFRGDNKLLFRTGEMEGTWCTEELKLALKEGATIELYKVMHWENRSHTLFTPYVNRHLKNKQEAAGWPQDAVTEEQKQQYIKDYFDNEGIQLDYEKIEKNPGMYAVSKLCLNSHWGKFGERPNMPQTTTVYNEKEFNKIMHEPKYQVSDFFFLEHDAIMLTYSYKVQYAPQPTSNVVIAVFTTCHARCRLYEAIKVLGPRLVYCDTDSMVYLEKDGEQLLQTGRYLGDLTDELGGDYITEFVSLGPKSYAYKTSKGKLEQKVKGFKLDVKASDVVTWDKMVGLATDPDSFLQVPQKFKFNRQKDFTIAKENPKEKALRFTSNKRCSGEVNELGLMTTIPHYEPKKQRLM